MAALSTDAGQIATFVDHLFRYASDGQCISVRAFKEDHPTDEPPFILEPVEINGSGLGPVIDAAVRGAERAAAAVEPIVFCPPIAGFISKAEPWRAREQDLNEAFALSVECDDHPSQARQTLEALIGPATIVVASGGEWVDPGSGEIEPKLHLHWRLNEPASGQVLPTLKEARRLATRIAGGDASNVPAVHPIRWPGTLHRKREARLAQIVEADSDREIDLVDTLGRLRDAAPQEERSDHSRTAEPHREDRRPIATLIEDVATGRSYHPALVPLAARFLGSGMYPGAVVNVLRELMDGIPPEARDKRWQARRADLPRTVETARAKYGANAPTPAMFDLSKWASNSYAGDAPPIDHLVDRTITMGEPFVLAAMGDAGKSGLLTEVSRRVAYGSSSLEPPIFGGRVIREGTAVIFTAEDNKAAVHRRLAAMDTKNARAGPNGSRLIIVPLPEEGGPMPLIKETREGLVTTDHYHRICDQLSKITDLVLVVFDPMQAFAQAPINDSPEAGQFFCSQMATIAASTKAAVGVAHHMRKSSKPILTLADARDAIRGTTAIVDGMRLAYALWLAEEGTARAVCQELRTPFEPNKVVLGGVVKANGPARRKIATYVRSETGLLIDRSAMLLRSAPNQAEDLDTLVAAIGAAAIGGQPLTKTGANGIHNQRARLPDTLRNIGRNRLEAMTQQALDRGLVVTAMASGSHSVKWLDVPCGPFAEGLGEFKHGATEPGDTASVSRSRASR